MPGLDSNTKLLLHFDGADASTTFIDSALTPHTMTTVADAQLDTGATKFGATGLFDGTGDYVSAADSADWDVFVTSTETWTVDAWIKLADSGAGVHGILGQYTANDYWFIRYQSGVKFAAYTITGDHEITATGGTIADTSWYHIAIIKISDGIFGVYLDGVQVAYTSSTTDHSAVAADLYVGRTNNSYFNGNMEELRIQKSNYFAAVPNVGLTDRITVPIHAYNTFVPVPRLETLGRTLASGRLSSVGRLTAVARIEI